MKKILFIAFPFLTFLLLNEKISKAQSGDLVIQHVILSPDTVIANQPSTLSYDLKNIGNTTDSFYSNTIAVYIYIDTFTSTPFSYSLNPIKVDSIHLSSNLLPPNDSFSFSSIINIPSGVAYAMRNKDNEVIIWPSKAFSDNDYSNNFYRKIFYFKDFTGIATVENELLKVSIMPNPTKEKLNISCDDLTGSAGIKIFNAIGTKVYEQSISNLPLTSINIATWAKGIYFLQMNYKGRNKMMKFVVE